MNTVKMTARRSQYYGRDLKAGESFEATEEHAELLERTGAAEREPAETESADSKKRTYKRRDLEAEK